MNRLLGEVGCVYGCSIMLCHLHMLRSRKLVLNVANAGMYIHVHACMCVLNEYSVCVCVKAWEKPYCVAEVVQFPWQRHIPQQQTRRSRRGLKKLVASSPR